MPFSATDAAAVQRLIYGALPQRLLSRLGGLAAGLRGGILTTAFIRWFIRRYGVRLDEAEESSPSGYPSFQAFFTRTLRPGARTWPADPAFIASPVDGVVSAAGPIAGGTLIQAKGITYSLERLLDSDPAVYEGGRFATLYLRPHDYHRIHLPLDGRLTAIRHCPGRLWPVRPWAVDSVPGLFAANERAALDFQGDAGPFALVMVGAMMVGGLETVVTGRIARGRYAPDCWNLETAPRPFTRGEEIGRFNFGSTVILLLGRGSGELDREALVPGREVRLGEAIGRIRR